MGRLWRNLDEFITEINATARETKSRDVIEGVKVLSELIENGLLARAVQQAWCVGWLASSSHHVQMWRIKSMEAGRKRGRETRKKDAAKKTDEWIKAISEMRRINPRLPLTTACKRLAKQMPPRKRPSWRTIYSRVREFF